MKNYIENAMRTDNAYGPELLARVTNISFLRLLHCAMGLCTESGELMDILKRHLFYGTPIDYAHIREEFGDLEWYKALGYDELINNLKQEGLTRENIQEHTQEVNIAKLRKRYSEKFTEHEAINRDLLAEENILGKSGGNLV